jgi:hypothetical protein
MQAIRGGECQEKKMATQHAQHALRTLLQATRSTSQAHKRSAML